MKQYIVDRHTDPSNPTLVPVPSERIPVYENKAEMESDLANLGENEFVMTKDTGEELSDPVNVVEEGNLNAVTSNAVAQTLNGDGKTFNFPEILTIGHGNASGSEVDMSITLPKEITYNGDLGSGAFSGTVYYVRNSSEQVTSNMYVSRVRLRPPNIALVSVKKNSGNFTAYQLYAVSLFALQITTPTT